MTSDDRDRPMPGSGKRREALMILLCALLGVAAMVLVSIGIVTQVGPLGDMIAEVHQAVAPQEPGPVSMPPARNVSAQTDDEPPSPHAAVPRNLPEWITSDDYPAAALNAGQQGTVGTELRVAADGAVTGCAVTQSSGVTLLDETTCRLAMRRARFLPARDSAGLPLDATWRRRVVWKMSE